MKKALSLILAALMFVSCFAGMSFTASAEPQNGWYQDGDDWYYFENGSAITGWKQIKGKWYYFEGEGVMVCNTYDYIDGDIYVFNKNGAMYANGWGYITEELMDDYGDIYTQKYWFYLNKSGKAVLDDWKKIDGKWYFFDEYGFMLTGRQTIQGEEYYFNDSGVMQTGFFTMKTVDSYRYVYYYNAYANSSGVLQLGWVTVDGKEYYLPSPEGNGYIDEFEGKGIVAINDSGALIKGWGSFTDEYGETQWVYCNSKGKVQTGWRKSGGKWYYLYGLENPQYYGIMARGIVKIDGDLYAFDKNGAMITGWGKVLWEPVVGYNSRSVEEYWVYAGSDGILRTGWQKIDGKWFYIMPDDFMAGIMLKGCATIEGKKYFFDDNGVWHKSPTNGWKQINNVHYYFGSPNTQTEWYYYKNGEPVTGWQKISGKWYYFDNFGKMVVGNYLINGDLYLFGTDGAWINKQGWNELKSSYTVGGETLNNGAWFYLRSDSTCATGWQTIGGKDYYFSASGMMAGYGGGVEYISSEGYCFAFNKDGSLYTPSTAGWMKRTETGIDSSGKLETVTKWYYVFPRGATAADDWMYINNQWYYFDKNGVMVSHTCTVIDGDVYTFSSSGALFDPAKPAGQ